MGVVGGKVRSAVRAPARAARAPSPYYHIVLTFILLTFILILLLTFILILLLTFILTFFSFKWMGVVGGKVRSAGRAPARAAQVPSPYYHIVLTFILLTFILTFFFPIILLTFILTFFFPIILLTFILTFFFFFPSCRRSGGASAQPDRS